MTETTIRTASVASGSRITILRTSTVKRKIHENIENGANSTTATPQSARKSISFLTTDKNNNKIIEANDLFKREPVR